MTSFPKFQFFLFLLGSCCVMQALPLAEKSDEVEDSVEPLPPKLEVTDQTCPGRSYSRPGGGGYIGSGPIPAPAALPRVISEDSILSKPLEEFVVRSKRHEERDTETERVETTTTPRSFEADTIEFLYANTGDDSDRKTNTSEVIAEMDLAREVDLCFLVDVTGSMSPYIAGVRDSINDIVNDLLNSSLTENFVEDLRIAFVGYRDFGDGEDQFTILPFTDNVTDFRDFVASTPAKGGANIPEDVYGGLEESLNLGWGEPSRTRLIFHIADAPGHGCELHLLPSDDFPGGDPKERTAEGLFGRMKDMEIQYFFGNITSDTDVMISAFSEAFGSQVKTFDIGVSAGPYEYGVGGLRGESGRYGAPAAGAIYESVKSAVESSVAVKGKGSK